MAQKIYNELCDLDFMDYTESIESDLDFIQALIDEIGAVNARAYLLDYFS